MIQYNVVLIYEKNKMEAYNRIMNHSQKVLPFDHSGNADRWAFSEENVPYVGDIFVLKTSDKETAKTAHKKFGELEGILALPPTVS